MCPLQGSLSLSLLSKNNLLNCPTSDTQRIKSTGTVTWMFRIPHKSGRRKSFLVLSQMQTMWSVGLIANCDLTASLLSFVPFYYIWKHPGCVFATCCCTILSWCVNCGGFCLRQKLTDFFWDKNKERKTKYEVKKRGRLYVTLVSKLLLSSTWWPCCQNASKSVFTVWSNLCLICKFCLISNSALKVLIPCVGGIYFFLLKFFVKALFD